MTIVELKEALRAGEVNFKFTKKDGTIREAKGTTNPSLIAEYVTSNSDSDVKSKKEKPLDMVVYFDLDKKSFRSFRESQFINE